MLDYRTEVPVRNFFRYAAAGAVFPVAYCLLVACFIKLSVIFLSNYAAGFGGILIALITVIGVYSVSLPLAGGLSFFILPRIGFNRRFFVLVVGFALTCEAYEVTRFTLPGAGDLIVVSITAAAGALAYVITGALLHTPKSARVLFSVILILALGYIMHVLHQADPASPLLNGYKLPSLP